MTPELCDPRCVSCSGHECLLSFPLFREDRGLTVDWPSSYIYDCTTWVVSVTPRLLFSPGERTPATHCTGGWVGPRAGEDSEARGAIKLLCLCRRSNPDRPGVQSVVRPCTRAVQWLRRSILVGFVVDKWYWDRFFSEFFGFPCHYHSITLPQSLLSSGGWTTCPSVAAVQRHSLTPSKSTVYRPCTGRVNPTVSKYIPVVKYATTRGLCGRQLRHVTDLHTIWSGQ
jgi:hypothetical protein